MFLAFVAKFSFGVVGSGVWVTYAFGVSSPHPPPPPPHPPPPLEHSVTVKFTVLVSRNSL